MFTIDNCEFDAYDCHLTSNNCKSPDHRMQNIEGITDYLSLWGGYLNGIDYSSEHRKIRDCNSIVIGDMNDVSGSSCLRTLADIGLLGEMVASGMELRFTNHYHIELTTSFITMIYLKLKSIKKIDANGLSDHDALVAEFVID